MPENLEISTQLKLSSPASMDSYPLCIMVRSMRDTSHVPVTMLHSNLSMQLLIPITTL